MKYNKLRIKMLVTLLLLFTLSSCRNYEFSKDENGAITITKYICLYPIRTVKIPKMIDNHPIRTIGTNAFDDCSTVTSVIIPDTVLTIGDWAFAGCTNLKAISIPTSVNKIGAGAFSGCTNLKTISIPTSVNEIGFDVFSNCTSLISVNIPSSVKAIRSDTFSNSGLSSIVIPDNVEYLGDRVFANCSNLYSVTINSKKISIGYQSFLNCKNLNVVVLPADTSNISIGGGAFQHCNSLPMEMKQDIIKRFGGHPFFLLFKGDMNGKILQAIGYQGEPVGRSQSFTSLDYKSFKKRGLIFYELVFANNKVSLRNDDKFTSDVYNSKQNDFIDYSILNNDDGTNTIIIPNKLVLSSNIHGWIAKNDIVYSKDIVFPDYDYDSFKFTPLTVGKVDFTKGLAPLPKKKHTPKQK